jgi:hypothetical protein
MVQRLKRWESPRKQGRNDKGKGGTARARQLRKREQMLRQKLKTRIDDVKDIKSVESNDTKHKSSSKPKQLEHKKHQEREITPSLFYWQLVRSMEQAKSYNLSISNPESTMPLCPYAYVSRNNYSSGSSNHSVTLIHLVTECSQVNYQDCLNHCRHLDCVADYLRH